MTKFHSIAADKRLAVLRKAMKKRKINVFIVPHRDEYSNEFLPDNLQRLAFASNFTGSAGWAVIHDRHDCALFVDPRYTLQAQIESRRHFLIKPLGREHIRTWLRETLQQRDRLGYVPSLHTSEEIDFIQMICREKGAFLVSCNPNPIDEVWQRPAADPGTIIPHPIEYCGHGIAEKLRIIRADIHAYGCDGLLIASPANLCWLFNIRGNQVPYSPIVMGRALVGYDGKTQLFFQDGGVYGLDILTHLEDHATIEPMAHLSTSLSGWDSVLIDRQHGHQELCDIIRSAGCKVILGDDPCTKRKATKNSVELDGARRAHIRDGAALTRFLVRIDRDPPATEIDAATMIEYMRRGDPLYHGPSFPTIAANGANGAIIHYSATEKSNQKLRSGDLFLLDSGGQYPDGTTDVTRTVVIGGAKRVDCQKHYTLVLKGLVYLSSRSFPPHAAGSQIDAFARMALWQEGLDYSHGTGHGVGSFSHVHEGPWRIATGASETNIPGGVIFSIEPGYYYPQHYGIRLENLAIWQRMEDKSVFETLTLVPFDRRLIDTALLDRGEIAWLDRYHDRVFRAIAPLLEKQERDWLEKMCAPLAAQAANR